MASSPRHRLLGRDGLPNFPSTIVRGGKGRSFETLPPPVPQVGGVLGQHWKAWQCLGADN